MDFQVTPCGIAHRVRDLSPAPSPIPSRIIWERDVSLPSMDRERIRMSDEMLTVIAAKAMEGRGR